MQHLVILTCTQGVSSDWKVVNAVKTDPDINIFGSQLSEVLSKVLTQGYILRCQTGLSAHEHKSRSLILTFTKSIDE